MPRMGYSRGVFYWGGIEVGSSQLPLGSHKLPLGSHRL
jgi:hypothetical protein